MRKPMTCSLRVAWPPVLYDLAAAGRLSYDAIALCSTRLRLSSPSRPIGLIRPIRPISLTKEGTMPKRGEIDYLSNLDAAGVLHAVHKPFSDPGCARYLA